MFQWQGLWLPDGEKHLPDEMAQQGVLLEGMPTYQYGKYAAAMNLVIQNRVAVDVGAHVGLWSRVMSVDFNHVYAFEPVPEHQECWDLNMHDHTNATLHRVALGNEEKTAVMTSKPGSSCETWVDEAGDEVAIKKLDGFNLTDVDFLKIDCEGYELFVLQGGRETIERCRPVICVEQKPGHAGRYDLNDTEAVDYLLTLGATLHGELAGDYFLSWPK